MSNAKQKIEVAANILIIVAVVILIGVVAQKYFYSSSSSSAPPPYQSPAVGQKISLPDVDFSKSNKNVLLMLQRGCKFCSQSAEFYKTLVQKTQGKNVKIIAVLPQKKEEAEEYLTSLGISGIETREAQIETFQVGGTPTLVIVNDKGEISNVWVGKLQTNEENEVIYKLLS
jgi:thioredoxin-related protein